MTESGKNTASFFFANEHNNLNTNTKPQAKNQRFIVIPEEKQQLVEEKDEDKKGKCFVDHSFIQWF